MSTSDRCIIQLMTLEITIETYFHNIQKFQANVPRRNILLFIYITSIKNIPCLRQLRNVGQESLTSSCASHSFHQPAAAPCYIHTCPTAIPMEQYSRNLSAIFCAITYRIKPGYLLSSHCKPSIILEFIIQKLLRTMPDNIMRCLLLGQYSNSTSVKVTRMQSAMSYAKSSGTVGVGLKNNLRGD